MNRNIYHYKITAELPITAGCLSEAEEKLNFIRERLEWTLNNVSVELVRDEQITINIED